MSREKLMTRVGRAEGKESEILAERGGRMETDEEQEAETVCLDQTECSAKSLRQTY